MAISMLKLKNIMEQKGLKKYDLRKAGFNPNIIDKVLSGTLNKQKRVDTETINRLCEYLNCQPGDIMEYVDDSDKDKFFFNSENNYKKHKNNNQSEKR